MSQPAQVQKDQPGKSTKMLPEPQDKMKHYRAGGKLEGKTALITGGDSGIGRAVAIGFAKEGADVFLTYLSEDKDARVTKQLIEQEGRRCEMMSGDIGDPAFCESLAETAIKTFGKIDILVNNAAEQHLQDRLEDISPEQLERTFRTNIFGMFFLTQKILPQMKEDSSIINTTSVTAYHGRPDLVDYSSTKGAIVAFTRSLAKQLAERGIRVNGVAPGPIWTPLIPCTMSEKQVAQFGDDTEMGRAGQPDEVAPSYIFLASSDSSYMTGQVLHPNGGSIVNG